MAPVHISRKTIVPVTYGSSHSDDFSHHSGGPHNPDGTQGNVCHADVPSRHKEIADIAGVEAPVRHSIVVNPLAYAYGLEFLAGKPFAVLRVGVVQVYVPGRGHCAVFIRNSFCDILFSKHVVSNKPSGLSLSVDVCHPTEAAVSPFLIVLQMVFQIAPV